MSDGHALSRYAFTGHGDDAELYNGIHDLETKLLRMTERTTKAEELLERLVDAVDGFMQTELVGTKHWKKGYVLLASSVVKEARSRVTP